MASLPYPNLNLHHHHHHHPNPNLDPDLDPSPESTRGPTPTHDQVAFLPVVGQLSLAAYAAAQDNKASMLAAAATSPALTLTPNP